MSQDTSSDMSRRTFLAGTGAAGALALAGCTQETGSGSSETTSKTSGGRVSGEIIVKGSSTVFPISDQMAQDFMAEYPNVNVTVDSTGTGGGFNNWFCAGDSAINGASRPITSGEKEQCSSNDVTPVEFRVAGDALTMAVNNEADWVDCVSYDELTQIWRDGGATKWSDVRDDWPDEEFELYGPATTSGTFDWFNNNVLGSDVKHTANHQPTEEDETIVQGIRDNTAAMGYFGYAYYKSNSDMVKALSIKKNADGNCTQPSLDNAKDGSYPMARPLYVYVAESALQRDEVYQFMRYYIENAETNLVKEIGYVPSSKDQRDANLEKLDEVAGK